MATDSHQASGTLGSVSALDIDVLVRAFGVSRDRVVASLRDPGFQACVEVLDLSAYPAAPART